MLTLYIYLAALLHRCLGFRLCGDGSYTHVGGWCWCALIHICVEVTYKRYDTKRSAIYSTMNLYIIEYTRLAIYGWQGLGWMAKEQGVLVHCLLCDMQNMMEQHGGICTHKTFTLLPSANIHFVDAAGLVWVCSMLSTQSFRSRFFDALCWSSHLYIYIYIYHRVYISHLICLTDWFDRIRFWLEQTV